MRTADDYRGNPGVQRLQRTVIKGGYCIGCGACSVLSESALVIAMNAIGQYEATVPSLEPRAGASKSVEDVCPFSNSAANEDLLARQWFARLCKHHHPHAGYYVESFAGYVREGGFRAAGSSGGFGSWILAELFEKDLIDYVINVQPSAGGSGTEPLYRYTISNSVDGIRLGAKSRYYPVEMSQVLMTVKEIPGRYAIVGIPCFVKALRLLQRQEPVFLERIRYCVGLVCGHLKSKGFAESLAWQMGIDPGTLTNVDFRVKDTDAPASSYKIAVADGSREVVSPTSDLFGTDWGVGAFKYKACDFCDDVFAETADITLGDAWLPEFVNDSQGTNIILVRLPSLKKLLVDAELDGRIHLEPLPIDRLVMSQTGGIRHRRDAIAYRLALARQTGSWVPPKRVRPSSLTFPRFEKVRQSFRIKLRELSHSAFAEAREKGDLSYYLETLQPLADEYKRLPADLVGRLISALRRMLKRVP